MHENQNIYFVNNDIDDFTYESERTYNVFK